jgi:hypothetical protein
MSLQLAKSPGIEAKTNTFDDKVHLHHPKSAWSDIDMEDFCELVKYVLTNTDLMPMDPRLGLCEFVSKLHIMDGHNPNQQRLGVPEKR